MEEQIKNINELKFGDILILRNGEKYVYAAERMYGEDDNYYNDCDYVSSYYNNDFTWEDNNPEYDIVKVIREGKIVYKSPVKEMTLEQVCEELGYEVKIIKDGSED